MAYETKLWPSIKARYNSGKRSVPVRLIVVHAMDALAGPTTAENVGQYFAGEPTGKASSTIGVDSDSIVQYVPDSYVANAAPGANHDGIQVELAGYSKWTRAQWLEPKSLATLVLGADACAQYAHKYNIPLYQLSNAELRGGSRGFVGHYQVSEVYRKSDHTDPGPGFPWDLFMGMVKLMFVERA